MQAFKLIILSLIGFMLLFNMSFAANCPQNQSQAQQEGWQVFGDFSGGFKYAVWQSTNTMYCFYHNSNLSFGSVAFKPGINKPTGPNWTYYPHNRAWLWCNQPDNLKACSF